MGCLISGSRFRWPNRTIPFEISDQILPPGRDVIDDAIGKWNSKTVIELVERDNESDYVEFVRGDAPCTSPVGRQGGRQAVTCTYESSGSVIHEIGHAVGLQHEHQRGDRNLFVLVRLEHVQPDFLFALDMLIDDAVDIGPYDYDSVMHYPTQAFPIEWRPGSVIEGQASAQPPAVAEFPLPPAGLHMVHLDAGSHNISWSIYDGTLWTKSDGTPGSERIPGQLSKSTPALATFRDELHMVHLGERSNDIWWSIYDGTSWTENKRIPGQQSRAAPELATLGTQLHMVHTGGADDDIRNSIKLVSEAEWGRQARTYIGQSRAASAQQPPGAPPRAPTQADHVAIASPRFLGFYMLHTAPQTPTRITQTVFDSTIETIAPPGVPIGLTGQLSDGDVNTVAVAYP